MQQLKKWALEAVERIKAAPVIPFDLAAAFADFTISLLQNNLETRLFGIDLASRKRLVVSGVESHFQAVGATIAHYNPVEEMAN